MSLTERSTFHVLHSSEVAGPYQQTFGKAGNECQVQNLQLSKNACEVLP
jgi:hypothetical protein